MVVTVDTEDQIPVLAPSECSSANGPTALENELKFVIFNHICPGKPGLWCVSTNII